MKGIMRANTFSYSEAFFTEAYCGSRTWSGRWWHSDNWNFCGDFSECFKGPTGTHQELLGSTRTSKCSYCWGGDI